MTTWVVFGLVVLFALWGLIAVFFALEIPGIRAGTPFTRYLRGWIRDPRWWVRWPLGIVILGTIAVIVIGGIWLAYHLTYECVLTEGVGCL